jgi:hypothetical protein
MWSRSTWSPAGGSGAAACSPSRPAGFPDGLKVDADGRVYVSAPSGVLVSTGAHWTFLADEELMVQQDLDIREYTDSHHAANVPYILVLASGLVVDRIYCGYWFWGRPSIYDLWADLRDVYRRIRPDFDPLVPAARYEWFAMQRMSTSGSFGDADHDDALPLRRAVRAPGTKRILERAFGASRPLGDMAADDDTLSFLREGLTTTGLSKILWAGGQLAW